MKKLSYFFYSVVGAISICLVMTIVTAVKDYQERKAVESAPVTLPLPAEGHR